MAKPLSMDLRERVVTAVLKEGMSRGERRPGLGSESSAIKWARRHRETGSVAPLWMGGYKPRLLAGELRDWLLERVRRDFTLRGLVAELGERGVKVDYVQVWRFVHAERLSFKKRMAHPVCKGDVGRRAGLHQRIRSQGWTLAKMDIRAPRFLIDLRCRAPHLKPGFPGRRLDRYAICRSPHADFRAATALKRRLLSMMIRRPLVRRLDQSSSRGATPPRRSAPAWR